MYCNLIQCDHFADTCVVAEIDGELAGWISGYLLPDDPKTLFVWQVAVGKNARGRGLGRRMLAAILDRPECDQVERMQTTITKDNDASWGLFKGFASRRDADLSSEPHFRKEVHFQGEHDTEHMVTISLEEAAPAMRSAA
jgi:L-2,4-diaminobutyric acid acetyltransferase